MSERYPADSDANFNAWALDQTLKSHFFHEKLHEWGLIDVAQRIETVQGENLDWNLMSLGIVEEAWKKVIHRGIRPVMVFAHPWVLQNIGRSVGYYRMLAMVSQKSMSNLRLPVLQFEMGAKTPDDAQSQAIAKRLNPIISALIQFDASLEPREFDLWRGMAAGAQAGGSWRNLKGKKVERAVRQAILERLRKRNLLRAESSPRYELADGRTVVFADEPDVAIYRGERILAAIEIKGGIDTAGTLERVGAAIKSLRRARESNPAALTLLLIPEVSVTERAMDDLHINREVVNHWETIDAFLGDASRREEIFALLQI